MAFVNNTNFNMIRNEETRETLEGWRDEGFNREDIVNYFNDPSIAKQPRSDRKNVGLVRAITDEIGNKSITYSFPIII